VLAQTGRGQVRHLVVLIVCRTAVWSRILTDVGSTAAMLVGQNRFSLVLLSAMRCNRRGY